MTASPPVTPKLQVLLAEMCKVITLTHLAGGEADILVASSHSTGPECIMLLALYKNCWGMILAKIQAATLR